MTPLSLKLAVPGLELVCLLLLLQRMSWRNIPAFVGLFACDILSRLLLIADYRLMLFFFLVRILTRTGADVEVMRLNRIRIPEGAGGLAVGLGLSVSAFAAGLHPGLNVVQKTSLFSEYYHVLLFVSVASLQVYRMIRPKKEWELWNVYRVAMVAVLGVSMIASSFVKDGLGYLIFPATMHTYRLADLWIHLVLCGIFAALGVALHLKFPRVMAVKLERRRQRKISANAHELVMQKAS